MAASAYVDSVTGIAEMAVSSFVLSPARYRRRLLICLFRYFMYPAIWAI